MNLITVVYRKDLHNLLYQAYSLKKNWLGMKEWIIVSEDGYETYNFILNDVIPIMNGWNIIPVFAPKMVSDTGWWRQQVCKLWSVDTVSQQQYSLMLDAKNFLIKPVNQEWFIDANEVTKIRQWHKHWGLMDNHYMCCDFFKGSVEKKEFSYIQTPWVWRKDIVKLTIKEYKRKGCDIFKIDFLPCWEFDAYWFFAQDIIKWQDCPYFGEGIFYYPNDTSPEYALSKIRDIYIDGPFFSFHRLMAGHNSCVKFNNDLLSKLDIIDPDIINQWQELYDRYKNL